MASDVQRRENFRITYPEPERPAVVINKETYPVIDLSAGGLRILAGTNAEKLAALKSEVTIKLTFKSNKSCDVVGVYLRNNATEVIYILKLQIPANLINEEQIRLRKKYPNLKH